MKYGKRQLILASLVLALGAAVYLNWQLADTTLPVEGETTETESSTLGAAQLVNSNYVETVSDGTESEESEPGETVSVMTTVENEEDSAETAAALSDARMSRQTARDEAVELLEDILADAQADTAVKEAAVSEASLIAQNILKETK